MKVDIKKGIYSGETHQIRVGHRCGKVLLAIDESALEYNTIDAFKLGWDIVTKAGILQHNELVTVRINGKMIELPQQQSLQVGGALLRKCDDADDYQIRVKL